jgi:hypothetical protein
LRPPTYFEFFSDMDRVLDDYGWKIRRNWELKDSWSMLGNKDLPEIFFNPDGMAEIIAGCEKRRAS